jgi:hypothetical protein
MQANQNTTDSIPTRQLPPPGTLSLDHVAHFVPDMDAASGALEKLGFSLTPFSLQMTKDAAGEPVPAGAGNRCAMLASGYLEFLTPTSDTPVALQIRAAIARHTGQHLIAFGTPAAEDEHARLERHGFSPLPLVNLQREVDVSGEQRPARFSVVRVPPEAMPEGRVQFVQHHTPECLWQPKYLDHPNGVTGLLGAFVVADEPEEVAARFAHFTALLPKPIRGFVQLKTGRGDVFVGSGTACKALFGEEPPPVPAMAGYALACKDPKGLRDRLTALGCSVSESSPDLYAAILPPQIGSAWLFGTEAAYEDWLSPVCG